MPGRFLTLESDDWGAIRTPSAESLERCRSAGLEVDKNIYRTDALASGDDLDALFHTLASIRDMEGRPLPLTANVITANPDFEAIAASGFERYAYEPFTATFRRYPAHGRNLEKWREGLAAGLFRPQLHGREHLQIGRWMRALQQNKYGTRFCFLEGSTWTGRGDYSFMEAFDWDTEEEIPSQREILRDGIRLFRETFGFVPQSFIAPCYNWDPRLESVLSEEGVTLIQGVRNQLAPTGTFGTYRRIPHTCGERNARGLIYNIRNAYLEPSLLPGKDWVDSCLAQIAMAFRCNKPAVICSHRINFVGYISPINRDRGLRDLERLMHQVLKRWPDVRFLSTDELIPYLT